MTLRTLPAPGAEGAPAPGAEGVGKGREPPASGERNQALASEGLSRRQPEIRTTDHPAGRSTSGHRRSARVRPAEPPTTGADYTYRDEKVTLCLSRKAGTEITLSVARPIELALSDTGLIHSGPRALPDAGFGCRTL
jgi:hypothetical protein